MKKKLFLLVYCLPFFAYAGNAKGEPAMTTASVCSSYNPATNPTIHYVIQINTN